MNRRGFFAACAAAAIVPVIPEPKPITLLGKPIKWVSYMDDKSFVILDMQQAKAAMRIAFQRFKFRPPLPRPKGG